MKRWLLGLLALLCMVSMVACSKSAPSLQGEWKAQDALKKDYKIIFKKDKVTIGEHDYNYTVDGPKAKDNYTYYSLKVKDQGKETSYTVFFPTKSKETALFLQPNDDKEALKGQMLFALNKKENPDYYDYVKKYMK
ncbi:hypothetical protein [Streptococcus vestibularis]|uniref:Glycosyltransferase n=1 Tax=Streptococcus vestibularis F0396 TaxID=904306 RepID=E3CQ00_STRVE|nr:hypothetical protein [Streptococcus vestibularis]EFQ59113.1 hypothetical protein HMPREF9192_1251 [Streptococcus vestibularis F0396]MDU4284852.1 hypothetical protein [Streptococcus sp.]MBS6505804.1 hypothetical protein [Streptococcus vestibularis]MBT3132027.1 hypothetical protein [Streptococcus vestibularis]MCI5926878.1 hypothetical protein [Streptococcus vestibularis]